MSYHPLSQPQVEASVLLVDDDAALALQLQNHLAGNGFKVHWVKGVQAAEDALQLPFDLLVIDLTLPDGNGAELCTRMRPYLRSGIVICSSNDERSLRIEMLRTVADAYLVKPIDPDELVAILSSVQRRAGPALPSPMQVGLAPTMWRLDRVRQLLHIPMGIPVSLSQAECLLLQSIFSSPDRFIERQHLLEAFASKSVDINGPRLETLVSRLRSKVHSESGLKLPIRAWYGRGYSFTAHAAVI